MTTTTPMPAPSTELLRLSSQTSARLLLALDSTIRRGQSRLSAADLGRRLLLIRCLLDGIAHGDPLPETISVGNLVELRTSLLLATLRSPIVAPDPETPAEEPTATPV